MVNFDYFRTNCTEEFSLFFDATLWEKLILQAMHTESFVLNAVLGIGALRRFQLESEEFSIQNMVPLATVEYITRKYSEASKELCYRLGASTTDWKLGVLGSIVFLAIEVLQGNETEALVHFRSGLAILKSFLHSNYDMRHTRNASEHSRLSSIQSRTDDFDVLASAFTRLSVQQCLFVGSHRTVAIAPDVPIRFDSIAAARGSLNSIIAFVHTFLRCSDHKDLKILPFRPLPETVSLELAQTQAVLQSWHQAFSIFLSGTKKSDAKESYSTRVLLLQHLVAWIQTSTHFFSGQMIYDFYLDHFNHVVDLATAIVEVDNSLLAKSRGPCFTLDIAMAQPLYFVASRCRDPALRRRAINVMRKVGRPGVYTGKTFARVAEWIVKKEESYGFVDGALSEASRLQDIVLAFDYVEMGAAVSATNKTQNGALVCLVEYLDLLV